MRSQIRAPRTNTRSDSRGRRWETAEHGDRKPFSPACRIAATTTPPIDGKLPAQLQAERATFLVGEVDPLAVRRHARQHADREDGDRRTGDGLGRPVTLSSEAHGTW
jgi:hypothetical protein